MDNRLAGANFVRALACVMVLCHHIFQRISTDILPPSQSRLVDILTMGSFGVSAFFVLSGYLLARPFWRALDAGQPMPSLRIYALRRAARIFPGFWLALAVSFVLSVTVFGSAFDGRQILRFVAGFFGVFGFHWLTWFPVDVDGPLWSIGAELISYAVMPLLMLVIFALPFARGWVARLLWVGFIAVTVGLQSLAQTYLQPDSYQRDWAYGFVGGAKVWWPAYSPIAFFAMFAIGTLAAGVQVWLGRFRHWAFDIAFLAGLAIGGTGIAWQLPVPEGFGFAQIPYGYPTFPVGVAIMLISGPSSRFVPLVTERAPVAFLARISFGIYIWHFVLMELVRRFLFQHYEYRGMTNVAAWAWSSVGVLVLSAIIATVSYRFIEEPIMRWARRFEGPATRLSAAPAPAE